jgi:hypothetical protein
MRAVIQRAATHSVLLMTIVVGLAAATTPLLSTPLAACYTELPDVHHRVLLLGHRAAYSRTAGGDVNVTPHQNGRRQIDAAGVRRAGRAQSQQMVVADQIDTEMRTRGGFDPRAVVHRNTEERERSERAKTGIYRITTTRSLRARSPRRPTRQSPAARSSSLPRQKQFRSWRPSWSIQRSSAWLNWGSLSDTRPS